MTKSELNEILTMYFCRNIYDCKDCPFDNSGFCNKCQKNATRADVNEAVDILVDLGVINYSDAE